MAGRSVFISGLGLMGGSLAAALSKAGWQVRLHHRRPEVAAEAAVRGWGVAAGSIKEARDTDLAVVCTPILAIESQVRALARAGARVITDVGSAKAGLVLAMYDLASTYIGSHPMAGSHLQGLANADPLLFQGRLAIVTPTPASPAAAVALVEELWRAAGCRLMRLDAYEHDRAVAEASHLPHILASAAAAQLGEAAAPVAASGFRDTTRVAGSSPALWAEILLSNADAVAAGLQRAHAHLAQLRTALAAHDQAAVVRWLTLGQDGRSRFERRQEPDPGQRPPPA